MIKVVASNMVLNVIDRAFQAFGAVGISEDFPLAYMWANARTLRLADGPEGAPPGCSCLELSVE
ncbi:hypothetical protein GCM10011571_12490 [Marinithermofilum abyssi]|uniref:Acyl-CoA dehydrogenase/oxidase C-terminal domain-containing protein n=1 Tax=Marinithermofilum abyssi TaxID=1571185 RepID=A0A8J2VGY8_9BACL|nr:hypothetical protein GCM10011571_12490 [Marinithermofilum abyssi]